MVSRWILPVREQEYTSVIYIYVFILFYILLSFTYVYLFITYLYIIDIIIYYIYVFILVVYICDYLDALHKKSSNPSDREMHNCVSWIKLDRCMKNLGIQTKLLRI